MTKDEFLSEFSSDYTILNDVYSKYQMYISSEYLNKTFDSYFDISESPEYYLLDYVVTHYDVIEKLINTVFKIDDPELYENLDYIIESIDYTKIFSLFYYSIKVDIDLLINSLKDILMDLNLYKEVSIDKYYVESVLNNLLPYKIIANETY